jgi:hypothetical protein
MNRYLERTPARSATRWYSWGSTLAVVPETGPGFSIGADGWLEVPPGDILSDGDRISEADARWAYSDALTAFGNPPCITRLAPPGELRFFHWGWAANPTLAVMRDDDVTYSLGPRGWRRVHPAEALWCGCEISESEARRAYSDRLLTYGADPFRARQLELELERPTKRRTCITENSLASH